MMTGVAISPADIRNAAATGRDRPMTEMEGLTARLADTQRTLERLADSLEHRINVFMQAPTSLAGSTGTPEQNAPQPGALGSIRHHHERIDTAAGRIAKAIETIQGIL